MSIATTSDFEMAPARPLITPLALAAGCAALADWLFYGWDIGISYALFLAVLGLVILFADRARTSGTTRLILIVVFISGLLPLIEEVSFLPVSVATLTTAMAVLAMTAREPMSWPRQLFEAATIPLRGPFQLARDTIGALRNMKVWTPGWLGWLVAWIVPLSVFAIFLTLFSSANPLIEHSLMRIDFRKLFEHVDAWRLSFWIFTICMIWPLIYRRFKSRPAQKSEHAPVSARAASDGDYLLGTQAITRSLILFNLLFVLQTALDLTYLWGGAALPDSMTYAQYAHRGAYPLIATALLAAGFVLIAMRVGGPAEESRLIRPLVLIWIVQNIFLVVSSIFRLDLYVAAYSLTYLRLAAFIWMGLVAIGLLLILIQIARGKSNFWLLSANAAALTLVLYGCCFINAPSFIAFYNLAHCGAVGGTGPYLDQKYLASLGPQAIPPLEAYVGRIPALRSMIQDYRRDYESHDRPRNWRAWGFRSWRLERYLTNHRDTPSNPSQGNAG